MGTINNLLKTEKFIRRILYPFYNKEVYTKLSLPDQKHMIGTLLDYSKLFSHRTGFTKSLREFWQTKNILETIPKLLENTPEMKEILSNFAYAIKYNKPLIVKNVSGIWQAHPKFLDNNEVIADLSIKTVINLFEGFLIACDQDLILRVGRTLCPIDKLDNPYYYPALQHMLNSILVLNKVDVIHIAKMMGNVLDYSAYMDKPVNIQVVIESFVIKHTLMPFINLNKSISKFIMQNADNKLADHTQYSSIAHNQMKQPHPDIRKESIIIEGKPKFFDSKLIGEPLKKLALSRGYLSLTTSLNDDDKLYLMKRSTGDYGGNITQRWENKTITKEECIYAKNKLLEFAPILAAKAITTEAKLMKFTNLQHNINSDNSMVLVCSYIAKPPTDLDYDIFYKTYLEGKLDKVAIIKEIQLRKHALFPAQGQYVDKMQWERMIKFIIQALPPDIRITVEANYEKVKSLEI